MPDTFVPSKPIARVFREHSKESVSAFARRAGIGNQTFDGALRTQGMRFDTADKVICGLGPELWHSDPELAEIYREVGLRSVDFAHPTCERTERIMRRYVNMLIASLGIAGASRHLGRSSDYLRKALDKTPAT